MLSTARPPREPLPPGLVLGGAEPVSTERILGRYRLGPRIGAGASGTVFAATDPDRDGPVVVKFFDGEEDAYAAWAGELRLVLRFRHPHIVPCLDIGFDTVFRLPVLVFAQAQGGSLRRRLVEGRRLSPPEIARLLCEIGSALAYAHAQGVIHRDVKPENILLSSTEPGAPWLLTDFGAGRFLARGERARVPAGSLPYMAPEAFVGDAAAESDQFSLGVLGCELQLGRLPSRDELAQVRAELRATGALGALIARLCAADPAERFPDMQDAVSSLQQVRNDMKENADVLAYVRTYLAIERGLPAPEIEAVLARWGERGSLVDFLVEQGLLSRAKARTVDAIRKGYLDATLDSVFGPLRVPSVPSPATVPATGQVLPASPAVAAPVAAPEPAVVAKPEPPPSSVPAVVAKPEPTAAPAPEPPAASAPEPPVAAKPEPPVGTGAAPRALPGPKPAANIPLGPGVRIGRYVLQDALGEGATATVFRSFHELLSMPVAVKIFEPLDPTIDPEGAVRFRREAQALVRLTHPNIVRIVDIDVWEGKPFIVMEYVGETTLAMQIQNLGRLPAARIAQIGLAVADALHAATEQGMLHRDVKPSNILERRDGHIKLVDFGIASTRSAEGVLSDPQAKQGLVSGTPTYIAPEQAQNPSQIDFRADMYSLGATLYHAAVGRPVFIRPTAYDLLLAHIHEPPVHINDLDPAFDPHLAFVIHRMLQKRPEDRFASWQELKEALGISLQSRDEPELLITQTSTGVDMPRRSGEQPAIAAAESPTAASPPSPETAAQSSASHVSESPSWVPTALDAHPDIAHPPAVVPPSSVAFSDRVQAAFFSALAATQRAWLASPRLERGLAIGAVSLLLFTLAVLLGLSWRN